MRQFFLTHEEWNYLFYLFFHLFIECLFVKRAKDWKSCSVRFWHKSVRMSRDSNRLQIDDSAQNLVYTLLSVRLDGEYRGDDVIG